MDGDAVRSLQADRPVIYLLTGNSRLQFEGYNYCLPLYNRVPSTNLNTIRIISCCNGIQSQY